MHNLPILSEKRVLAYEILRITRFRRKEYVEKLGY